MDTPLYPLIDFLKPGFRYRVRKSFLYFKPGDEFRIMNCSLGLLPGAKTETINLDFPDMEALGIDVNPVENLDIIHEPEEFLQRRDPFDWEEATAEFKALLGKCT